MNEYKINVVIPVNADTKDEAIATLKVFFEDFEIPAEILDEVDNARCDK
jgi:hypothetical protein